MGTTESIYSSKGLEKYINIAEGLQAEAHEYIKALINKNSKLTYDACFTSWLYLKIASLQTRILELETKHPIFK